MSHDLSFKIHNLRGVDREFQNMNWIIVVAGRSGCGQPGNTI